MSEIVHFKEDTKVIEESPAILLNDETRAKLHEVVKATKYLKYEGAGTFEFLADDKQNIYFMEMNTRLQVEHPVSEMVSGIDIVELMIKVAEGKKSSLPQESIKFRGHAIECRITAEDPNSFLPCPGKVTQWMVPGGRNVRVDSLCLYKLYCTTTLWFNDWKINRLGRDRNKAINIMKKSFAEFGSWGN